MIQPRRWSPALLAVALVAGACGSAPGPTPAASGAARTPVPPGSPSTTERPFRAAAWPAAGSACDDEGYAGLLGRVEAVSARVVRFTLCEPDGAFPARLAHPALGLVDAAAIGAVAADPSAARGIAGAGSFRVEAWTPGENLRLARVDGPGTAGGPGPGATRRPDQPAGSASASPGSVPPPSVVLRWAPQASVRGAALRDAEVDGIDGPDPADAADMATLPELAIVARPGLSTAYLGFGAGRTFAPAAVRRAFAQALDHAALARDAFPPGSAPASFLTPCEVPAGCAGTPWYAFNGPAAAAALEAAGFDARTPIVLHAPDAPVPGVPDPAALAAAVRDQLATSIGVTVEIDTLPAAALAEAVAAGELDGLYLGGATSTLADPSGFLEPLFGADAGGTAATRAKGVSEALEAAAPETGDGRETAFAAVNDAIRTAAPVVPLVHAGDTVAYRADVTGVAVSPLGTDPLGSFVPGDRRQLVVMSATEPAGAWCALDPSPGALRLCALVAPGLYALAGASLVARPALATRCTPADGARTWTCRLRSGLEYTDGSTVDAGDVLEVVRTQADAGSDLRAALPAGAFAAWDELFGGTVSAGR